MAQPKSPRPGPSCRMTRQSSATTWMRTTRRLPSSIQPVSPVNRQLALLKPHPRYRAHGHVCDPARSRVAPSPAPEFVYSGGSASPNKLTPRPGSDQTGLSAFDNAAAIAPDGGNVQVIDTSKLKCTIACPDAPPPPGPCIGTASRPGDQITAGDVGRSHSTLVSCRG